MLLTPLLPDVPSSGLSPDEHARLVGLLERLHVVILARRDAPEIRSCLDELDALARVEFPLEEAALKRCHPPDLPAHHLEHEVLLEKLAMFRRAIDGVDGEPMDRAELYDFLTDWLLHVLTEPIPMERRRPSAGSPPG